MEDDATELNTEKECIRLRAELSTGFGVRSFSYEGWPDIISSFEKYNDQVAGDCLKEVNADEKFALVHVDDRRPAFLFQDGRILCPSEVECTDDASCDSSAHLCKCGLCVPKKDFHEHYSSDLECLSNYCHEDTISGEKTCLLDLSDECRHHDYCGSGYCHEDAISDTTSGEKSCLLDHLEICKDDTQCGSGYCREEDPSSSDKICLLANLHTCEDDTECGSDYCHEDTTSGEKTCLIDLYDECHVDEHCESGYCDIGGKDECLEAEIVGNDCADDTEVPPDISPEEPPEEDAGRK